MLSVSTGSYDTANQLNSLNKEIPIDDRERAEIITDFVASHLDARWLHQRCGTPREMRLSPAVFRYQLIQRAQAANKRIVLPEGSEPLTVQAAAICQARGIARCVLLAKPEDVEAVARAQGIDLPEGLEILDPDLIRQRYVEPMVALRKSKSLNAPMAEQQLEDTVVIATMMLALDEVDGLVSGVIHSTANTIRPALQLIKNRAGLHPGVVGVLHAVPRAGAGVRRLRDEPAPKRCRTGRDRPAKRRLGGRVRHHATGGDDQLFQR